MGVPKGARTVHQLAESGRCANSGRCGNSGRGWGKNERNESLPRYFLDLESYDSFRLDLFSTHLGKMFSFVTRIEALGK